MYQVLTHLDRAELDRALRALPAPPRDHGSVVLVVARPESGVRLTPERAALTPQGGLEGDRWGARPQRDRTRERERDSGGRRPS